MSFAMAALLWFRKHCVVEPAKWSSRKSPPPQKDEKEKVKEKETEKSDSSPLRRDKRQPREWRCLDNCCRAIGYICTTWWIFLFLLNFLPADLPGLRVPESPGVRLKREGLTALHPVVLVPGMVTGGLELWEGKPCSDGLFRKRLWGGTFTNIITRPMCWLDHLSLDNETGLDPPDIRVRAVPGFVAADYFAPGYFVWAILIQNLAKIGYEGKNMYMAAYDWRLSFQNTEVRDQSLSRLKSKIEFMYLTNGRRKVVVVPHSMGVIYFLHFMKWVEAPPPMGGGGGPDWCSKHIKAIMNIGPAFLGVPKTVGSLLSSESKDVAFIRAMVPGLLDSKTYGLKTLEHAMRVCRTWDSVVSLIPKGGDAIWGSLDSSPEEGHVCESFQERQMQGRSRDQKVNNSNDQAGFQLNRMSKYGRIISFGKEASQVPSSQFASLVPKGGLYSTASLSCGTVWTEYDEMSQEGISKVVENKAYTANTLLDLFRLVAPKMMRRAEAQFSHGIADGLDDPKYDHYKFWSNPLETKLPNAPDIEIYCLYGAGIPTERSYVYKQSPRDKCRTIPFQIDVSADGGSSCLRRGVYFVDGDETVPVLSAGFMCAKGWRGKTRFNPSGIATYVREFRHKAPASLLEGRGLESGAHVDIMGNVALIEDVLRVAAGATGAELGGDKIYSDIMKMSERVRLRV